MKELVAYRSRLRKLRRIFNYHQVLAESIWRHGSPYLGQGDDELSAVFSQLRRQLARLAVVTRQPLALRLELLALGRELLAKLGNRGHEVVDGLQRLRDSVFRKGDLLPDMKGGAGVIETEDEDFHDQL